MEERYAGSIFDRWGEIKYGQPMPGHKHNHDHLTLITRGVVRIDGVGPDGTEYSATKNPGGRLLIRKEVIHTLTRIAVAPPEVLAALAVFRAAILASPAVSHNMAEAVDDAYTVAVGEAAKTDAEYHCLYARRTLDGELTDDYTGFPDDPNAYR